MLRFCARRIAIGFVIVVLAISTIYVLVQAAPGDPIALMLGPRATPEMIAALEARLGLDQAMPVQVFNFLIGVFQGDLGIDIKTKRLVAEEVLEQLPHTLYLILASLLLAAGLGIPLGCFSALHRNSLADRLVGIMSVSVIAVPSLIIAIYGMITCAGCRRSALASAATCWTSSII
jgi:peptide/nickel transport system permease protein